MRVSISIAPAPTFCLLDPFPQKNIIIKFRAPFNLVQESRLHSCYQIQKMPISLKNMRGCASPASTAICNNTADHLSMPRRSASGTPRLSHRRYTNSAAPCISELPLNPRSFSSLKQHFTNDDCFSTRKSSADPRIPPMCLLTKTPSFQEVLQLRPVPVYRRDLDRSRALIKPGFTDESNQRPGLNERVRQQVVVLRVSLHCRGCEGKLRKHLSKMQGVTSFSIDLETKKVTVIGHVTPVDVLTSIAKVKNAQFWPSPFPS